jgi:hypothetical protein
MLIRIWLFQVDNHCLYCSNLSHLLASFDIYPASPQQPADFLDITCSVAAKQMIMSISRSNPINLKTCAYIDG